MHAYESERTRFIRDLITVSALIGLAVGVTVWKLIR